MRDRIREVGATSAVVVDRQIQRQLDFEVVSEGEANPETASYLSLPFPN